MIPSSAARDHLELNLNFNRYPWSELAATLDSWTRNFTHRVTDISSLGNVVSQQSRYVQLNFLPREKTLRLAMPVRPPTGVTVRGSRTGAILTWNNNLTGAAVFHVYRNGKKVGTVPWTETRYMDQASGNVRYAVSTVLADGRESCLSLPALCAAGTADKQPPQVVVISPPVSIRAGQPVWVKARLLDGRMPDMLTATLYYRTLGEKAWKRLPMTRRIKAIFAAALPPGEVSQFGVEYYVEAADGDNTAVFPASAPTKPISLVVEGNLPEQAMVLPPAALQVSSDWLSWNTTPRARLYRLYRSSQPDLTPHPAHYLTHVSAETTRFKDNGLDFSGLPLSGKVYYCVTAVDADGYESPSSPITFIEYPLRLSQNILSVL